jgi:hypothetical protein
MKPNFLNRFIKKLTRERVVPTISARVSWLILGITFSGFPFLPNRANSRSIRANRFSLELKSWFNQVFFVSDVPGQEIRDEHIGQRTFTVQCALHRLVFDTHEFAICHGGGRTHAQWLARQTPFAEEVRGIQYGDRGLFAILRQDCQSYPALLDVKGRIGGITLQVSTVFLSNVHNFPALTDVGRKYLDVDIILWARRQHILCLSLSDILLRQEAR